MRPLQRHRRPGFGSLDLVWPSGVLPVSAPTARQLQGAFLSMCPDNRKNRSSAPIVSCCQVDAAGVPAEWVEATVATHGQRTFVYFLRDGDRPGALTRSRPSAESFAVATGARVLTVACSSPRQTSQAAAIEDGLAAYAWLIGEGCDPLSTAFIDDSTGAELAEAVLVAAKNQGLPVPAGLPSGQHQGLMLISGSLGAPVGPSASHSGAVTLTGR